MRPRLLIAVFLLLTLAAFSQSSNGSRGSITVQNNGSAVGTASGGVTLNLVSGCTATQSGSIFALTCTGAGSGSNVTVAGGSNLATANFNAATPAAQSNFLNCTFQTSTTNVSLECPSGTSSSTFALGNVLANLSSDCTATSAGVITCTKIGGTTPGGTCTNQAVTAVSASAVPTCTTITSAYVDSSIAPVASPGLTGTPTAPTAAANTNTTQVATTAFVLGQTLPQNLYAADTGAVNAYVVTLAPPMTGPATGSYGCFKASAASTTTNPTVNFSGLGAKTIVRFAGGLIAPGDIGTNEPACMIYDGANFDLLNPQAITGTGRIPLQTAPTFLTSITTPALLTTTNCSSSASPAVCAAAAAGSVALPTGTNPTLVVNTTAVTANSQILLSVDESLGTKLSVTCNTTLSTLLNPVVTARTGGTSFTFTIGAVIASNPACVSYFIVN
jgi:hypothetical protein